MAVTKVSSTVHFVTRTTPLGASGEPATGCWTPNTDIYTTHTGLVIKVELAGMKSDSLEITIEGQRLHISGVRPDCCRAQHCSFLVMEITYGPFEAVLELPPGFNLNGAKAIYMNGFLRIDIPPAEPVEATMKKVPISDGH